MTCSDGLPQGICPGRAPAAPSRRGFLAGSSAGFGMLALSGLLGSRAAGATSATSRPRARNVIFGFMDGGPSHVDLFDPKPMLKAHEGTAVGGTALASVIGFVELTKAGTMITNATFKPFVVYSLVGLLYFALCYPISAYARSLERKMHVHSP